MCWRVVALLGVALIVAGEKIPLATFTGKVHGVSNKQITIENPDGNLVDFEINRKTRVMRGKKQAAQSDLATGDTVTIEARQETAFYRIGHLIAIVINMQAKPQP